MRSVRASMRISRAGDMRRSSRSCSRSVREQPLRERFRAQLMLALYRSGRQAEALDVYADARRTFVAELGLEPGPELQRAQQAILAHDPALDPPPMRPAARPRQRRLGLLAAAVVAALLVAAAVFAVTRDAGRRRTGRLGGGEPRRGSRCRAPARFDGAFRRVGRRARSRLAQGRSGSSMRTPRRCCRSPRTRVRSRRSRPEPPRPTSRPERMRCGS